MELIAPLKIPIRKTSHSLRAKLDDIRYGKAADPFGWNDMV